MGRIICTTLLRTAAVLVCDEAVLIVLEKEVALGPEYGLRNNYSKMVVYPLAGQQFVGDLSRFAALGIAIDYSGNVKFMQVLLNNPRFYQGMD